MDMTVDAGRRQSTHRRRPPADLLEFTKESPAQLDIVAVGQVADQDEIRLLPP